MEFLNTSSGELPVGRAMGYKLDGAALTNNPDYASPSFVGPATAGAIVDERFQPFLNALWSYLHRRNEFVFYGATGALTKSHKPHSIARAAAGIDSLCTGYGGR